MLRFNYTSQQGMHFYSCLKFDSKKWPLQNTRCTVKTIMIKRVDGKTDTEFRKS